MRREKAELARAVRESYNSEEAKLLRAQDALVRASERKLKKQKIDHEQKVEEANGPSLTEQDAITMAIAASLHEEAAPAVAAAAAIDVAAGSSSAAGPSSSSYEADVAAAIAATSYESDE